MSDEATKGRRGQDAGSGGQTPSSGLAKRVFAKHLFASADSRGRLSPTTAEGGRLPWTHVAANSAGQRRGAAMMNNPQSVITRS